MTENLNMLTILEEIEVARKHLYKLANENPLNSNEVIESSKKLDMLLNNLTKIEHN